MWKKPRGVKSSLVSKTMLEIWRVAFSRFVVSVSAIPQRSLAAVLSFERRTFFHETTRMYQISVARFPGPLWHISATLSVQRGDAFVNDEIHLPRGTSEVDSRGWITLQNVSSKPD